MNYLLQIQSLNNSEQEKAILCKDNSVFLACPGAGKTRTIVLKTAYLLEEVIKEPRGIACLTFSNMAAKEFQERFNKLKIKHKGFAFFGTIHSFCLCEIVMPFGKIFLSDTINEDTTVAEDNQRIDCLERALVDSGMDVNPRSYVYAVEKIRHLLRRKEAIAKKDADIINVCKSYEKNLRQENLIDFTDIIFLALDLLQNIPLVRKALSARYPWILIDEYQDLSESQHNIVKLLLQDELINIFAVGDPNQSIYGYSGADPKYLLDLCKQEDITVYNSKFNYRCAQPIIDGSISVLQESVSYLSKIANPLNGNIFHCQCPQGYDEQVNCIVEKIIPSLNEKAIPLGNVCLLTRKWKDADYFEKALSKQGVKTLIIKEAKYEFTRLTELIHDLAKWCAYDKEYSFDELFSRWIAYTQELDKSTKRLKLLSEKGKFFKILNSLREESLNLKEWLSKIDSGLGITHLVEAYSGVASNIKREIQSFRNMKQVVLSTSYGEQELSILKGASSSEDSLIIMTLHGSKGLQFDVVLMPMLEDGILPDWRGESLAEDRKLFYVGITRARQAVFLLYSGFTFTPYGRKIKGGPSRFLSDLITNNHCIPYYGNNW